MPISKFVKTRLSVAWIKYLTSELVGFRWRVQKKNTVILKKIKTSIVQVIVQIIDEPMFLPSFKEIVH